MKRKIHRTSRQRKVILEELRKVRSHPTAAEVYKMVSKRMPKISLGTVYRNLELLEKMGEITKLPCPGGQNRFDGNPKEHYHIRCLICGRVLDITSPPKISLDCLMSKTNDYEITGHRLEFFGKCSQCLQKQ